MKILFDYEIFYQQKVGGISSYFIHLANELTNNGMHIKFSCPLHKNVYLDQVPNKYKYGFNIKKFPESFKFLIENINFFFTQKMIKNYKPEIVHQTYYSSQNKKKNVKLVCTVYDMINEKFPNFFYNSNVITQIKKKTIFNADHVFCISQRTKQDLMEIFNIKEKKISVTLLASTITKNINKNPNFIATGNNLLFVGSRYGYKNFEGFIKAFSSSKFLTNNFKIIAFGGERYSKIDFDILKKNNIKKESIIFLNDRDCNLVDLYKSVSALIYPSLYEGFGLPILEAMGLGCPVISSNGGSLPEVGGSKLKYFNPNQIENIANVLEEVLSSEEIKKELIEYGFKRNSEFSWSKCALETIDAYKNIL